MTKRDVTKFLLGRTSGGDFISDSFYGTDPDYVAGAMLRQAEQQNSLLRDAAEARDRQARDERDRRESDVIRGKAEWAEQWLEDYSRKERKWISYADISSSKISNLKDDDLLKLGITLNKTMSP